MDDGNKISSQAGSSIFALTELPDDTRSSTPERKGSLNGISVNPTDSSPLHQELKAKAVDKKPLDSSAHSEEMKPFVNITGSKEGAMLSSSSQNEISTVNALRRIDVLKSSSSHLLDHLSELRSLNRDALALAKGELAVFAEGEALIQQLESNLTSINHIQKCFIEEDVTQDNELGSINDLLNSTLTSIEGAFEFIRFNQSSPSTDSSNLRKATLSSEDSSRGSESSQPVSESKSDGTRDGDEAISDDEDKNLGITTVSDSEGDAFDSWISIEPKDIPAESKDTAPEFDPSQNRPQARYGRRRNIDSEKK